MQQQKSFQKNNNEKAGALYLVPTPIGNLEDMTFRAVNVLKNVDLILAEDTRNSKKLLNHFEIATPQLSFHEHNTQERIPEIIAKLHSGLSVAQVSDAGMPVISDPGADLVKACINESINVIPLPGANAGLTSLIASGLPSDNFTFIGFLPRKKSERLEKLAALVNFPYTMIFYESPHRIRQTILDLQTVFGDEREATVARELTKTYEEFTRGTLVELAEYYGESRVIKGEICLIVAGNTAPITETSLLQSVLDERTLKEQVEWWMSQEKTSSKMAIKQVSKQTGIPKREVYDAYHEL